MQIKAKELPKWYMLRWKISNIFVWIGTKIYPENPSTKAYLMQVALDIAIMDNVVTRIDPTKIYED